VAGGVKRVEVCCATYCEQGSRSNYFLRWGEMERFF
jgi:hypothetical protein